MGWEVRDARVAPRPPIVLRVGMGGGPGSTATTTLKITTDPHSSHG